MPVVSCWPRGAARVTSHHSVPVSALKLHRACRARDRELGRGTQRCRLTLTDVVTGLAGVGEVRLGLRHGLGRRARRHSRHRRGQYRPHHHSSPQRACTHHSSPPAPLRRDHRPDAGWCGSAAHRLATAVCRGEAFLEKCTRRLDPGPHGPVAPGLGRKGSRRGSFLAAPPTSTCLKNEKDPDEKRVGVLLVQCARGDLNPHALSDTAHLKQRVCRSATRAWTANCGVRPPRSPNRPSATAARPTPRRGARDRRPAPARYPIRADVTIGQSHGNR